jgi:DNA-binding NarL/FixJ family response regulator
MTNSKRNIEVTLTNLNTAAIRESQISQTRRRYMLYKELADVASHFNRDDLDIDGILQSFCLRHFADIRFLASFLFQIEQDGTLHIRGFFGADPQEIGIVGSSLSIFDDHLAAESIRSDAMICSEFSSSKRPRKKSTMIAWPVQENARTLGSLVAITDAECAKSEEVTEFIDALAMLLNTAIAKRMEPMKALNGASHGHVKQGDVALRRSLTPHPEALTERQIVILKLISEGRTNLDIADALGYSESLIRQETIRIYAHLGCNGRHEAAKIYRSQYEEEIQEQFEANKVRINILTDH